MGGVIQNRHYKALYQADQFVVGEYTSALISAYVALEGSLEDLAKRQQISVAALCMPPEKISIDDYLSLMDSGQTLINNHFFPLQIGQKMHVDTFSVLGQALIRVASVGEALQEVLALEGMVHTLGNTGVVQEDGCVRLIWHCNYQLHPMAAAIVESVMSGIVAFSQRLAGRPIPILEATFIHARPAYLQSEHEIEYGRVFKSKCEFSANRNSILVDDHVLAWPNCLPSEADPSLGETDKLLSKQVMRYLESNLAQGRPTLVQVAQRYCSTVRTFQRKLEKEGLTYNDILSNVRLGLAKDYLRYSNLSALEISQILGFKEQSSFNHFFAAQLSVSPIEYRKLHER